MNKTDYILVAAPTTAGEQFIQLLKLKGLPFALITNNSSEQQQWTKLGVERVLLVDTVEPGSWVIPEYPIGNIYLFEKSFSLCCRYLHITRSWTSKSVYVITSNEHPRLIYKGLGADYVIHSKTGNVSFLIN